MHQRSVSAKAATAADAEPLSVIKNKKMNLKMIILLSGGIGEGILGFLSIIVAGFIVVLIASLFARATNTNVRYKSTVIEPFKTKKEREREMSAAKEEAENMQYLQLILEENKELNAFCAEFRRDEVNDTGWNNPSYSTILDNLELKGDAKQIEDLNNKTKVVSRYTSLKNALKNGVINREEYRIKGRQLYKDAIRIENLG